jgi:hypothetical protein
MIRGWAQGSPFSGRLPGCGRMRIMSSAPRPCHAGSNRANIGQREFRLPRLQGTLQGLQGSGPFDSRHQRSRGLQQSHPAKELSDGDMVNDRCITVSIEKVLGPCLRHSGAEPTKCLAKSDARRRHELGHFALKSSHPRRIKVSRPHAHRGLRGQSASAKQTRTVHPPSVARQVRQTLEHHRDGSFNHRARLKSNSAASHRHPLRLSLPVTVRATLHRYTDRDLMQTAARAVRVQLPGRLRAVKSLQPDSCLRVLPRDPDAQADGGQGAHSKPDSVPGSCRTSGGMTLTNSRVKWVRRTSRTPLLGRQGTAVAGVGVADRAAPLLARRRSGRPSARHQRRTKKVGDLCCAAVEDAHG